MRIFLLFVSVLTLFPLLAVGQSNGALQPDVIKVVPLAREIVEPLPAKLPTIPVVAASNAVNAAVASAPRLLNGNVIRSVGGVTPGHLVLTATSLAGAVGMPVQRAELWVSALNEAAASAQINSAARWAAFLAQMSVESQQFSALNENLNYRASRLALIFPKYFNAATAAKYAGSPAAIANRCYANRMGNGNEASGDGYKYRGRGLIQLTGRSNYELYGKELGIDLVSHPELAMTPQYAALIATKYWVKNGLNALADVGQIKTITQRINGGTNGYPERLAAYNKAMAYFKSHA